MPIYISRGRFTSDAVKGMLAKPENREEAVAKLFKRRGTVFNIEPASSQFRPSFFLLVGRRSAEPRGSTESRPTVKHNPSPNTANSLRSDIKRDLSPCRSYGALGWFIGPIL